MVKINKGKETTAKTMTKHKIKQNQWNSPHQQNKAGKYVIIRYADNMGQII